jgi:hypothetical protein
MERLLGQQPDYSLLCTFGCACWPNLRPYNTHKLAFRSKHCVFLGFNNQHKGYKCLDSSSGRVYISRDVIFDETVFPFSTLHPNVGALLKAEISLLHPMLLSPQEGVCVEEFNMPNVANALHEPFAETGDLVVSNSEPNQRFMISNASHVGSGATKDPIINPGADSQDQRKQPRIRGVSYLPRVRCKSVQSCMTPRQMQHLRDLLHLMWPWMKTWLSLVWMHLIVTPCVTLFPNYLHYKLSQALSAMVNHVVEVRNQNSKSGVRI